MARKKFSTRTTFGCEMIASARPSSKKHFRPWRNAERFAVSSMFTSVPSERSASEAGRYSLMANGVCASSWAR